MQVPPYNINTNVCFLHQVLCLSRLISSMRRGLEDRRVQAVFYAFPLRQSSSSVVDLWDVGSDVSIAGCWSHPLFFVVSVCCTRFGTSSQTSGIYICLVTIVVFVGTRVRVLQRLEDSAIHHICAMLPGSFRAAVGLIHCYMDTSF